MARHNIYILPTNWQFASNADTWLLMQIRTISSHKSTFPWDLESWSDVNQSIYRIDSSRFTWGCNENLTSIKSSINKYFNMDWLSISNIIRFDGEGKFDERNCSRRLIFCDKKSIIDIQVNLPIYKWKWMSKTSGWINIKDNSSNTGTSMANPLTYRRNNI